MYYFLTYTLVSYISLHPNVIIFSVNGDNGWDYWTSKDQFWCIYFHHWEIICFTWGKIIKLFFLFFSISYRRILLTAFINHKKKLLLGRLYNKCTSFLFFPYKIKILIKNHFIFQPWCLFFVECRYSGCYLHEWGYVYP